MDDKVSASDLIAVDRSPLIYQHKRSTAIDSDAFRVGRATHTATLEPEKYEYQYVVYDGKRRAGKHWEQFSEDYKDVTILTAAQDIAARGMADAVRSHPVASEILSYGEAEVTLFWTDPSGVEMKARLDWVGSCVADLKTSRDVSPHAVSNACARYGYPIQFATYVDAAMAVIRKALPFKAIFVEKSPPHQVAVYNVPDKVFMVGREKRDAAIKTLLECRKTRVWHGVDGGEELTLSLPLWCTDEHEEELTFGGQSLRF
jgi:hypothetical protein